MDISFGIWCSKTEIEALDTHSLELMFSGDMNWEDWKEYSMTNWSSGVLGFYLLGYYQKYGFALEVFVM
jgi:hypothetical protein